MTGLVGTRRTALAAPASAPGTGKASFSLADAAQVMVLATALLPLVGVLMRLIEYSVVPAIPASAVFSESAGSLTYFGVLALIVPGVALFVLVLLGTTGSGAAAIGNEAPATKARHGGARLIAGGARLIAGGARLIRSRWMAGVAVSYVLLTALLWPFPMGLGVAVGTAILLYLGQGIPGTRLTVLELAPGLLLALLVTAVMMGLQARPGQPVYIITSQSSAIRSGWYIQLGDSRDPTYLLTCSGGNVIAAPASSIQSVIYAPSSLSDTSLLHIVLTRHLEGFGLRPVCPTGPPPGP